MFEIWTPDIWKRSKTGHICVRISNGQTFCFYHSKTGQICQGFQIWDHLTTGHKLIILKPDLFGIRMFTVQGHKKPGIFVLFLKGPLA
jgi:hypothetical protein